MCAFPNAAFPDTYRSALDGNKPLQTFQQDFSKKLFNNLTAITYELRILQSNLITLFEIEIELCLNLNQSACTLSGQRKPGLLSSL